MKGLGIGTIGQGLMQGYQFADNIARQKRDEARLDAESERRAAMQGLQMEQIRQNMDKTRAEMDDYAANADIRTAEREKKEADLQYERDSQVNMDALAQARILDGNSQNLDGSIGYINKLGKDFGIQVKPGSGMIDPKTGAVSMMFIGEDGAEKPYTYPSMDDYEDALMQLGNPRMRAAGIAARRAKADEIAKEERQHKRELEKIEAQGKNSAKVARINQEGRMDLLEFKRDFESRNGTGRVLSMADRGKLAIEWAGEIGKTREGKKMTPEALLAAAKKQVDSLYVDAAPAPAPAPAAAAGVNPPKPGNAPASGNTPSVVIPLDKYVR